MYTIKKDVCDDLLKISDDGMEGYPNRQIIEEYKDGSRKAQENTVRALAALLKVDDWKELVT
jgi:hypothetical protein